jgi:hypothetical protein
MQTRDQIREQVRADIRNAIQDARDAARQATQARTEAAVVAQGGLPAEQAMAILRAEINGTRQEITALTQQLTPDLSHAREMAIDGQIDAANDRLRALQGQLDRLVSGEEAAVTVVPPFVPDEIPPQAVTISLWFMGTLAVTIIAIPIVRAWARWLERRGQPAPSAPDVGPRLDRIEQAIEAVAIEVERVSEGQRFTNKLMSEWRGLPAPAAEARWPAAAAREPVMARRPQEG